MNDIVFITGNQHKADFLAQWLGRPMPHRNIDLEELQSLDLSEVVRHKARSAYDIAGQPVLVEDISLTFLAMGQLPGTFIKWFLQEMPLQQLASLANGFDDNSAEARIIYALYDGTDLHEFEGRTPGTIAQSPRGSSWGWNNIFIPAGAEKTYGEMSDQEFHDCSHRGKALAQLKAFLVQAETY